MPNENAKLLTAVSVAFMLLAGCAHGSQIADLKSVSGDEPIELHTTSGRLIILQKWALDGRGNIVGVSENLSVVSPDSAKPRWRSRTIALDSIQVIRKHEPSLADAAKTATTAAGVIAIVAAVYYILDFCLDNSFMNR